MAFRFKRKERVARGVRRMGRECCDDAIAALKECDQAEAIHEVRKNIKKARAVLCLIRTEISGKCLRRQRKLLRLAANHLSRARDAYVTAASLKALRQHFKGQLSPGALRHLRAALHRSLADEKQSFVDRRVVQRVERTLRAAGKGMTCLDLKKKGWKAMDSGIQSSYARGRQAYREVLEDASSENFHEWRKRAKALWYQVRMLRSIWSEEMDTTAAELKSLGEDLGNEHDLVMLRQEVGKQREQDDSREVETVKALINQRQQELRVKALALGERFYAEKPSAFCARLAGYWRAWRKEKQGTLGLES